MLFGREVLLELVDDMVLTISYLLVGCRYLICFLGSFSYRSKVILKGIKNITGTGYSSTIIIAEHSWCTESYSFEGS